MKTKKKFFMECRLAGRKYHDADEVWPELKVGTKLALERDWENRYDPQAVAVTYTNDADTYLLGYVPRDENEVLASLLDMGWDQIFETRISRITPDAPADNQVQLTIRIVRNPAIINN